MRHIRNEVWWDMLFFHTRELQKFFFGLAKSEKTEVIGNALYIRQQAGDYAHTLELMYQNIHMNRTSPGQPLGVDPAYRVHARTELSRILALALRECEHWGWDFFEAISEGVEYELDVRKAIEAGTRDTVPTYERR